MSPRNPSTLAAETISAEFSQGSLDTIAELQSEIARLRRSEAHYRAVIDSANDFAILTTDLDGVVTSWSPGAEKLLGWRAQEIVGAAADRIWTAEDRQSDIPATEMNTARDTGRCEDERWHVRKDGTRFWGSGLMERFEDEVSGNCVGYLKIMRDRTVQRQAEERLRESEALARSLYESRAAAARLAEARFRGVFDSVREFYGILTLEGVILEVNRAAADKAGISLTDAVGQFVWQSPWFAGTPEAVEMLETSLPNAVNGVETQRELTLALPTGTLRTFEIALMPIRDEAGAVILVTISGIDITESLATAEQLRQSQKLEAIGQLTGGVAHDFNNLLTVIRGSVELLRREGLSDEKRARYLDAIGDTADRAAKLTGQLLSFARRQALKPELFDAGRSLRDVAGMVGTLAGSHIIVDIEEPKNPCFILADRGQFDTAIVNLAINARDAMGGEGLLRMSTGPVTGIPAIRTHGPVEGSFIAVTITDTGAGIKPDLIGRIFEPFFTTKDPGQGTGLGLSQVFGFAKQSGGDIRVKSTEGEGATFTLYLPCAPQEEHPEDFVDVELALLDGAGVCVLLVEDNAEVGEFATGALAELGYDSVHVMSAEGALEELEKDCDRFHVVFSDVVMPGRSGLELAQDIRRLYPHVPVVLTSGYSNVLALSGRQGFELLHKPYSLEQLSHALQMAVSRAPACDGADRRYRGEKALSTQ